jgi:hypothetical protein
MQNITINKSLKNSSKVRFYNDPTIEINSSEISVLSSSISKNLIQILEEIYPTSPAINFNNHK